MRRWFFVGIFLSLTSAQLWADELVVAYKNEELTIERYQNADSAWRFVWLHSQYDRLLEWERPLLMQLQQSGVEVWATDILGSLFLTRSSASVRQLSGEAVAAVLEIAQQASNEDGKGIVVLASDRMAGLALKGVRAWQQQNVSEPTNFKGSILLFPNLYANTPLAGEAPNWDAVVEVNQAPVMILQPEQGVHRWYLADLSTQLAQQQAAVYSWVLPGVKDYFFNPFAKQRTEPENVMTAQLPTIFQLSAQRLAAYAASHHPAQLAQIQNDQAVNVHRTLPKLHEFSALKPAPGLVGKTFDEQALDLADYKGKVVLVNFWATWCPPCVTEIPSMNRLLAKYQAQGLEIVSVDFQQSATDIATFVKRVPVDYPIVLDHDGRLSKQWGVFSFPTTFVVDRQGRLRYSLNQGVEWDVPELEAPLRALLAETD